MGLIYNARYLLGLVGGVDIHRVMNRQYNSDGLIIQDIKI